jgi:hypothetical protein
MDMKDSILIMLFKKKRHLSNRYELEQRRNNKKFAAIATVIQIPEQLLRSGNGRNGNQRLFSKQN